MFFRKDDTSFTIADVMVLVCIAVVLLLLHHKPEHSTPKLLEKSEQI